MYNVNNVIIMNKLSKNYYKGKKNKPASIFSATIKIIEQINFTVAFNLHGRISITVVSVITFPKLCSGRKGVLRNFAKFTGKHLPQSLFFNKVAGLGTFLTEHLWATASMFWKRVFKSNILHQAIPPPSVISLSPFFRYEKYRRGIIASSFAQIRYNF